MAKAVRKIENGRVVYRNMDGKKLYPVCSWEKNQHKLYNAHDRAMIYIYDARQSGDLEELDKAEAELDRIDNAMSAFDFGIQIDGVVWATWEDSKIIKDITWAYNARH